MKYLLVFLGGGIGSALRLWISVFIREYITLPAFFSTLFVNALGSAILGALVAYFSKSVNYSEGVVLMLTVGFCGGFTTFSTFSLDVFNLIRDGVFWQAGLYVLASLSISIIMLVAGWMAVQSSL